MFYHTGDKLKICAYLFAILSIIKSLLQQLCFHIVSMNTFWRLTQDIFLSLLIALLIYAFGCMIKKHEDNEIS